MLRIRTKVQWGTVLVIILGVIVTAAVDSCQEARSNERISQIQGQVLKTLVAGTPEASVRAFFKRNNLDFYFDPRNRIVYSTIRGRGLTFATLVIQIQLNADGKVESASAERHLTGP